MAIEQLTTIDWGSVIAFFYALAISGVAVFKAVQAKNYKAAAEAGGALLTDILDYLDPTKPEADTAPAEVAERFGTETVPVIAADGLSIGDIEVVGLYEKWVKYEPQNQIPLTKVQQGGKIYVPIESKRAGNATVGLKIDDTIYDVQHFDVRSDFIQLAGSTDHPDKNRLMYFFDVPTIITPGEHTFSIVEGYKTNTMSYDEVCWYEESPRTPVQVTTGETANKIVIST